MRNLPVLDLWILNNKVTRFCQMLSKNGICFDICIFQVEWKILEFWPKILKGFLVGFLVKAFCLSRRLQSHGQDWGSKCIVLPPGLSSSLRLSSTLQLSIFRTLQEGKSAQLVLGGPRTLLEGTEGRASCLPDQRLLAPSTFFILIAEFGFSD